jgi:hypothetical protein
VAKNKKPQEDNRVLMRHVLEVRLKKKLFSFLDFNGGMIDKFVKEFSCDQIKWQGGGMRFDVVQQDASNAYFCSWENFGFQSELHEDFDSFKEKVRDFIRVMKQTSQYTLDGGLARVGTMSTVFYHRRFDSITTLKKAYMEDLLRDSPRFAELTKSEIRDTGHNFELKLKESAAGIFTGPVTKKEAAEKFFGGASSKLYEKGLDRDNGMLFQVDVWGDKPEDIQNWEQLETQIISQIGDVQQVVDGLKSYFGSAPDSRG